MRTIAAVPSREEIRRICHQRFSKEAWEKLQQARVAVAGLGGLGSNICIMLARSGIGRLKLVDFDRVDLSNLNRQAYDIRHLGRKKTEALSERLRELNPYIELETWEGKITADNALEVFRGWPYICEAFDNAEAKAMLAEQILWASRQQNQTAEQSGQSSDGGHGKQHSDGGGSEKITKTWEPILISGSGMAGFGDANKIHTRKVNNRFYICGDEQTDLAEGMGLMAPRVTVCAGHQANKIIQLILA